MPARFTAFVRANARLLGFGVLMAFSSSFGQTFYVSLFGGEIRAAFALDHGGFGLVYSTATLASGLIIVNLGRLIDHVDLRLWSAGLCAGLALAALATGTAGAVVLLGLALFGLRLFGQGLLSHAATTTMARYFAAGLRGRAVSIAALGFPLGEALLPALAVAAIALLGWRTTWLLTAALVAVLVLPLSLWLLRGHGERHAALLAAVPSSYAGGGATSDHGRHQWTRAEVVRDPRFALAMLAMLSPAFVVTGVFFHQVHIVEVKGWAMGWFAGSFVVYALAQVLSTTTAGWLVDRFGGRRLAPFYLLPMAAGVAVLAALETPLAAPLFMALTGATSGVSATLMSVLWAELYGVLHLGAIRALVLGASVIASALSPALLGWLVDAGAGVPALLWGCAVYALAASALLAALFRSGRGAPA